MKKSKNNNIILGFSFQFYVFGFSLSNGLDKNFMKKIVASEIVKACDELDHKLQWQHNQCKTQNVP